MGTVYPSAIDSFTTKQDFVDTIYANHVNDLQDSIVAIESELGTLPKGSYADVSARLDALEAAGGWDPWELVSDDFSAGGLTKPQWHMRGFDLAIQSDSANSRVVLSGSIRSQYRPWSKGVMGQWARGDFDVRAHFQWYVSTTNSRYSGLVALVDEQNYVFLARGYYNGQILLYSHIREAPEKETTVSFSATDYWLRLTRTGSTFAAYYSTDGTNYTQIADPSPALSTDFDVFVGVWAREPLSAANPIYFLEFQVV